MQVNAVVNMAEAGVLVTISGPALSLLLYENARSSGDQIGLLLGNVLTFVTKKVTDCERHVEKTEHHINIETVTVCSKDIIKDGVGRIHPEKLDSTISNMEKRVVGWFHFRKHNFLQPTMKDKILHKEFASHFWNLTHANEEHFIMLLLNASITTNLGTHKFRHVCLQYCRDLYRPVAMRVNNLGDDVACLDGSDYKSVPQSRLRDTNCFTKLVDGLRLNPNNTSSVKMVSIIEKESEDYLHEIIGEVCRSDEEVSKLQEDINLLRAKLKKKNWRNYITQIEKASEVQHSIESEKISTTAQIHGSPRSTHSYDLFDTDSPPHVPLSNSQFQNPHLMKKQSFERTSQSPVSKENRSYSCSEFTYRDIARSTSNSSPDKSRGRGLQKISKSSVDEKYSSSRRQTSSPKNFGSNSQEETLPLVNKEPTP